MRRLPKLLIVLGALALAYAATSALWREPVSDLYARVQQHRLERELDRATAAYAERSNADALADAILVAGNAAAARSRERKPAPTVPRVARGRPLARLSIPRIGLRTVVVEGTRASDLRKGPGHYEMTALPGTGKLVAIAGHRTTFGAPFRHIDELRAGDTIEVSTVYGRFRYRVFEHEIVAKDDWTILRPRTFETLVLSACHPLYSARQRWVVYARLVEGDREG
ncbi:MAG: class E sortase [Actinomycetota bacterium]|nr:class E sortase [Actinomycetota bacterium]